MTGKNLTDEEWLGRAARLGDTGELLLDDLAAFVERFVVFATEHQSTAVALWIAHTWAFEAADTTPRLAIQSPERESGKTRLLEVLELLVREPMQALDATPAALFRSIAAGAVTFLVDETDTVFNSKTGDDKSADVRAILNAGYRRGAVVPRADPKTLQVERCPVFAPVALAGIGILPETVQSRSIEIALRRRKADEVIERFRRRRASAEAEKLRQRCVSWAEEHVEKLRDADPELPDEIGDRAQDFWEPLLAIADEAGGDWPERASAAAVAISAPVAAQHESVTVRMLADCRDIIDAETIPSKVLAAKLAAIDDAPWGEWFGKPITTTAVARLLDGHAHPRKLRDGDRTYRGYLRADFVDSWQRYLPAPEEAEAEPPDVTDLFGGTPENPEHPEQVEQQPSSARDVPGVPTVPPLQGYPPESEDPPAAPPQTRDDLEAFGRELRERYTAEPPPTKHTWQRPCRGHKRKKDTITAEYRAEGWPNKNGPEPTSPWATDKAGVEGCHAQLRRANAGLPPCDAIGVWRITRTGSARADGTYVGHYCDADLPDEDRPPEVTETSTQPEGSTT